ncbi:MAG: SEC59/DGK1/VTE5 family protein [Ignavibacteriales bacterium]
MKKSDPATIDYKTEVLRKSIHLTSLSISIAYYYVSREFALSLLIPVTLIVLIADLLRYYYSPFSKLFYSVFGFMLRKHEVDKKKKNLNGATYVLIAVTLSVYFFPKAFVIPAVAVLILGDIAAALIGRKWGKHKFLSKSFEGTLAFFIAGCLVIMASPKVNGGILEYLIGFVAVGASAIAENISFGWADDNFTIPLTMCIVMSLLYYFFMPGINVILPNVPN